jgi:argininosuccinate lyase
MKLWGGRFKGEIDSHFAVFNASFRFDRRLLESDIEASQAHAEALGRAGVLSSDEVDAITAGLSRIEDTKDVEPAVEDVHSFIESQLVGLIGAAGQKLHTARSRNDQVAVATRLFLRREIDRIDQLARAFQIDLIQLAEQYADAPIPGYTHLQKAQPILFSHFLLAYFNMIARDRERFTEVRRRVNILPLGSGALAGTNFKIDRQWIAERLGFSGVSHNSLDAVSDRDYLIEFTSAAAICMMHLSRLAEDMIIYSTAEFGLIKLEDAIATGSSIMPQKKNPDSLELVRGKSARVFGHLSALLTLLKGLPLAYNKDLQEDKEALFDTIDTLAGSLQVMSIVVRNIELDRPAGERAAATDYTNATDLADYLVGRGLEFRKAHEIAGRTVIYASERGKELGELSLDELRQLSDLFGEDVFESISLEASLAGKDQVGGTAPVQVESELRRARESLEREQATDSIIR